jgi:hypothetical protein
MEADDLVLVPGDEHRVDRHPAFGPFVAVIGVIDTT